MADEAGNAGSPTTARSTTTSSSARELGGERFRTDSTPRSCSRAYDRWGAGALDHLRGMFAFALWDERRERAVLRARPLRHQAVLLRRRRRRPLLRLRGQGAAAVPAGDRDRPRGAQGLPHVPVLPRPARRCSRASASSCPDTCSWLAERRAVTPSATGRSTTSSTSSTRRATSRSRSRRSCSESVALHLRSDVPVGAYLSGGLDSSAVASLASRQLRREPLKAFTGKFSEDPRYDESRYARAARRRARPRAPRDRHRRRGLRRHHRARHLPPRLPGRRPGLVPAVHGLPGGQPARAR